MITHHLFYVQGLSDSELADIIEHPANHDPDVVQAALVEIQNRKLLDDAEGAEEDEINSSEASQSIYAGLISRFVAYTIDVIVMIILPLSVCF